MRVQPLSQTKTRYSYAKICINFKISIFENRIIKAAFCAKFLLSERSTKLPLETLMGKILNIWIFTSFGVHIQFNNQKTNVILK